MLLIHSCPLRYVAIDAPLAYFLSVALITHRNFVNVPIDMHMRYVRGRFAAVAPTVLAKFPTFSRTLRTPAMSPPVVIAGATTTKTELLDLWLAANLA